MQTLQLSKCRHCGALQPEGAGACSSCGAKLGAPHAVSKSGGARLRAVPNQQGLDPKALLAKIDSLDWDPTTTMDGPLPAATAGPPPSWRLLLLPMLSGLGILLIGGAILFFWSNRHEPTAEERPTVAPSEPMVPVVSIPAPTAVEVETPVPAPAPETAHEEERAKVLQVAESAAKRRADKKRKAAAEQQAREEQERQRKAEEERLRAEREAAEARARAAAVVPPPAKPASVRALCAKEDGLFARSNCEARACAQAEWRSTEYCIQRWQEQMRKLNNAL